MKLSVIIPYYNAERWISRCLDSLLNQGLSATDYEIIVVDDGSDHNIDLLKGYVEKHPQIKYVWQENARQGAARNNGISQALGDYLMFCDADDYVHPNVLGQLVDIAKGNDLDVLFYDFKSTSDDEFVDSPGKSSDLTIFSSGKEYMDSLTTFPPTFPWRYLIRRGFVVGADLRFPKLLFLEDEIFFMDMVKVAQRTGCTSLLAYYYFCNSTSITHYQGKIQRSEDYASCMYECINQIDGEGIYLKHRDFRVFVLLHNVVRFCALITTFDYVRKLKGIGVLPMRSTIMDGGKWNMLRDIMNKPFLWCTAATFLHILPRSIRIKLLGSR
jgi:glycosyltransferase involved in cell wall biosynthesis